VLWLETLPSTIHHRSMVKLL